MKVQINKIIPFSSVDGPGNRTAIFLQGCNIDCKYCHNPETRSLCTGCGKCVSSCPVSALEISGSGKPKFNAEKCVSCDTCIKVCPFGSSPKTEELSPEEVYEKVKKQIPFIRGITVSGGECMLSPEFLKELFSLAKKDGLGTPIDTNGTVLFEDKPELLEVTDGVMLDIKAFEREEHEKVTGAVNENVLKNAAFLAKNKKLYEVRLVIVPELYDTEKSVEKTGEFLKPFLEVKSFRIKLIAYRPIGVRKEYANFKVPSEEYLRHLEGILREQGFEDIIIT